MMLENKAAQHLEHHLHQIYAHAHGLQFFCNSDDLEWATGKLCFRLWVI